MKKLTSEASVCLMYKFDCCRFLCQWSSQSPSQKPCMPFDFAKHESRPTGHTHTLSITLLPPSFPYSLITFSWPLWSLLTQCLFPPSPGGHCSPFPPGCVKPLNTVLITSSVMVSCALPHLGRSPEKPNKGINSHLEVTNWYSSSVPSMVFSG